MHPRLTAPTSGGAARILGPANLPNRRVASLVHASASEPSATNGVLTRLRFVSAECRRLVVQKRRVNSQGYANFGLVVLWRLAWGASAWADRERHSARGLLVVSHSHMMVDLALLEFA